MKRFRLLTWLAMAACVILVTGPVRAGRELVIGPVAADVERVIDGDTFVAVAHVWPGHDVRVSVRIRGIDAPEMRSRCPAERAAARQAQATLEALLSSGPVLLGNVGGGKYYGRVLADVVAADGQAAAGLLLKDGLARPYRGDRRLPYCG
jgi:endonuclease YncB( thermonuclease family)